jgi:hypothetical protein
MDDRVAARERRAQLAPPRAVEHLELEVALVQTLPEVVERSPREVVDPDDLDALRDQAVTEVRSDEPGRAGDPHLLHHDLLSQTTSL